MTPELRTLGPTERDAAAAVLGHGMRDNPLHVAAFGAEPVARERSLGRLIGACRFTLGDKARFFPSLSRGNSWVALFRVLGWSGAWARRDPDEPHWHLGPVGVLRELQGKGVGGGLLRSFCGIVDAARARAYLETDKAENVKIYERFGFGVTAESPVLGVPCWFMSRPAR